MNKSDLIKSLAEESGIPQTKVKALVDSALHRIIAATGRGERVALADFGVFTVATRAERQGRNPATKQPMTIPAHRVVKFKASFDV